MAESVRPGHPFADALLGGADREAGNRANSRAALVEAAIDEFGANGYEATTVAAIAKRAGVTTGALYAHFSGKLELLLAAIGLTPIGEIERSADDLASLPGTTAASWLTRALGALVDERMVLLLDVIVVARRDPRIARALRSGLEAYVGATTRVVEAATASGAVSPVVEATDASRLLALISLGGTVFAALDADPPSPDAFTRAGEVLLRPSSPGDSDGDREPALARVRACATAAESAENNLHDAIAAAVDAGHSLRQIGAAAGRSHEGIRRLHRARR